MQAMDVMDSDWAALLGSNIWVRKTRELDHAMDLFNLRDSGAGRCTM